MGFVKDHDRFCSTPKLPLFSYPMNRVYESPGLATPPVNIAGSVPFLWEEAPGKPRFSSKKRVLKCLDEPSQSTVLDGGYDLRRRSLSLPRSAEVIRKLREVPAPVPGTVTAKERRVVGSSRWGSFGKCKEVKDGVFEFSRFRDGGCNCRRDWGGSGGDFGGGGGAKVKLYRIKRKGSLFNLSHTKSDFWAKVYEGFKQLLSKNRKHET